MCSDKTGYSEHSAASQSYNTEWIPFGQMDKKIDDTLNLHPELRSGYMRGRYPKTVNQGRLKGWDRRMEQWNKKGSGREGRKKGRDGGREGGRGREGEGEGEGEGENKTNRRGKNTW